METGTVLKWEMDGAKSKGFGFLETRTGERVFCHRTAIKDGNPIMTHGSEHPPGSGARI